LKTVSTALNDCTVVGAGRARDCLSHPKYRCIEQPDALAEFQW